MTQKTDEEKKGIVTMKEIAVFVIMVALLGILYSVVDSIVNSQVELEGHCSFENLSFDSNSTIPIQNLTLDNGKIDCEFKVKAPLIVAWGFDP